MKEGMALCGGKPLSRPSLEGRWVLLQGRVPRTNENQHLRSLSEMQSRREEQRQQKSKVINVIRDQPLSLLTKEQA